MRHYMQIAAGDFGPKRVGVGQGSAKHSQFEKGPGHVEDNNGI